MRKRVIRSEGHTASGTALHVQKQTVVALSRSVIDEAKRPDVLSVLRPFEAQPPALIRVGRRGARTGCSETKLSGQAVAWNIDRGIDRILAPDMCRQSADIVRRNKPVICQLTLQTEIPR